VGRPATWYRRLLGLLPRDLLDRFGRDLEELHEGRLARAVGPAGRLRVWMDAVIDVFACAVREGAARVLGAGKGRGGMGRTMHDLEEAFRAIRAAPLFTLAAILTLGLGIGAASATFAVVHAVILKDLPYREPERLVMVWPEQNYNVSMVAMTHDAVPALEGISGISMWTLTLTGEREPRELTAAFVSPSHFELLGVRPALGRDFLPDEAVDGAGGVAVLSHDAWVGIFGADPDILGRVVHLAGSNHTERQIVGVMPAGFRPLREDPDLWAPLEGPASPDIATDRTWYVNWRVGRLAPGASIETAQEQLRAFAGSARERAPQIIDEEDVRTASVRPLGAYVAGALTPTLWVALGAVVLVLLIACANVANLLLARGEARGRDLAVRVALGAKRANVVRMLMAESGAIGLLGGAMGVAMSFGLVRLVVSRAPADFPRLDEVGVSWTVLLFALVATLVSTLLAGLAPALRGSRVDATHSLARASRSGSGHARTRLTGALVAGQVALASVVAVGSGLMLRSLQQLLAVDPGMDGTGVLTFRADPGEGRYGGPGAYDAFYGQLVERLRALPGVTSVGAIHILPGTTSNWSFPTFPEGVSHPEGTAIPSTNFRAVRPGYFQTVRIPLLEGRTLTDADRVGDQRVLVVNRAFAERWWPEGEAVGKTVRVFSADATPYRVVGVVGDVRQHARDREPLPELYYPQSQWDLFAVGQYLLVRFGDGSDPLAHAAQARDVVWGLDADVPVTEVRSLESVLDSSTRTLRFLTMLLAAFGSIAVLLGAIGVFGVTAYTVGRRVPEFGLRVALGSTRGALVGVAVARAVAPVVGGLAAGLGSALMLSRLLTATLYGVEPSDPFTFAAVAALLAVVGGVAAFLPAWRAGRVDPVSVLNRE